jgi:hypothetical protein
MENRVNSSIFNSNIGGRKVSRGRQIEFRSLVMFLCAFLLATAGGAVVLWKARGDRFRAIAVDARLPESRDLYLAYFKGSLDDFIIYDGLDDTAPNLQHADVLFLGNSRMLYALRDFQMLETFFSSRGLRYYMLAFQYGEGSEFPGAIIRAHDLHPKWVIVNADPFFGIGPSALASKVMSSGRFGALKFRFETFAAFEAQHFIHKFVPYLAPQRNTDWIYARSKRNGMLDLLAFKGKGAPAIPGSNNLGSILNPAQLTAAKEFKEELRVRGANLILTWIPPSSGNAAEQLALALNVPLIAPEVSGLNTFDGSHLDMESSRRFGNALLMELGKIIVVKQARGGTSK